MLKAAPLLFTLLPLAGCVPSLQPLFTDNDLIFDRALLGAWKEADGESTWVVRGAPGNRYEATHTESGEPRRFKLRLLRLGKHEFLDIDPGESLSSKNETFNMHHLPVHMFYKIVRKGGTISVWALEDSYLKRLLAERKTGAGQVVVDAFVFTASTPQLQAFLTRHAGDSGLFTQPAVFHRVP
jgi:hypothetical protein